MISRWTGSMPRTSMASISSRIRRAPRSAHMADPPAPVEVVQVVERRPLPSLVRGLHLLPGPLHGLLRFLLAAVALLTGLLRRPTGFLAAVDFGTLSRVAGSVGALDACPWRRRMPRFPSLVGPGGRPRRAV